jgi:hemoglobin
MPKQQTGAGPGATVPAASAPETSAAHLTSLEHRILLNHPAGFRPFRGTDLFERIGGQLTVSRLVDLLYDAIEDDGQLRPLFPRDLASGRSMQKLFFAEWLGGPARYSERAYAGLQQRHSDRPITSALAGRWLDHFRQAMDATIAAESDRRSIFAQVHSLALALHNARGAETQSGLPQLAWCGVGARPVARATDLARRGNVAALSAMLAEAPGLLHPSFSPAIMQAAALAGRGEIVRMLLTRGGGADSPFFLPVGITGQAFERVIFVTPLCAARMTHRAEVESLLRGAGAHEDAFTSAFLGDLTTLTQMLVAAPSLARTTDPAVDVLDITPVEHAVAGGQPAALRLILDHLGQRLPGGVRALRGAAAQGSLAMVDMLLAHGADAARIGVGRWVLHAKLAPLLASHGAKIDSSGSWIGASCTGNQGRRDDPEYVRALLRHGARADDRRSGGPEGTAGVRALGATALHYAVKAGFLKTIEVLIEHGADPDARDSRGRTPLEWLEGAAPSVSRAAVRNLIKAAPTASSRRARAEQAMSVVSDYD